jgi:hypothetical protein
MCSDGDQAHSHLVAKDSSGHGNDLPLVSVPLRRDVTITKVHAFCPNNLPMALTGKSKQFSE